MTLQDLRYVVALADHGHFGRAAAACDIGQSTLSTQIKKLEAELGATLFERTTQIGERDGHTGADIAGARAPGPGGCRGHRQRRAARISGPLAGGFSLGVIPTLGPYLLPWLVPALKQDYPGLRLTVREDLTAPSAGAGSGPTGWTPRWSRCRCPTTGWRASPLFDEPFWFAEPKGRTRRRRPDHEGGRSARAAAAAADRGPLPARPGAGDLRDAAASDAEGDFRATSLETILQMVATGLGSTLLPAMACSDARARAPSRCGRWRLGWGGASASLGAAAIARVGMTSTCWRTPCATICRRASTASDPAD